MYVLVSIYMYNTYTHTHTDFSFFPSRTILDSSWSSLISRPKLVKSFKGTVSSQQLKPEGWHSMSLFITQQLERALKVEACSLVRICLSSLSFSWWNLVKSICMININNENLMIIKIRIHKKNKLKILNGTWYMSSIFFNTSRLSSSALLIKNADMQIPS